MVGNVNEEKLASFKEMGLGCRYLHDFRIPLQHLNFFPFFLSQVRPVRGFMQELQAPWTLCKRLP